MKTTGKNMNSTCAQALLAAALVCAMDFTTTAVQAAAPSTALGAGPLPSWNDGKAKQAIVTFVEKGTKEGSPDFVPPADRITTFDNDGTLWAEQPMYFQKALDEAQAKSRTVVDMKNDWKRIFAFEQ